VPETNDLILRKAVQEDWYDMYHNIWSHPESARYMFWEITTSEEDAVARMERTIKFQASHDYHWTVVEKSSGRAIGWAGLEVLRPGVCAETGIAIGPSFTQRGYGKQILNALTSYAHQHLGAERFIACCREENAASRKLQISCGFRFSHTEQMLDPRNQSLFTMQYYEKEL